MDVGLVAGTVAGAVAVVNGIKVVVGVVGTITVAVGVVVMAPAAFMDVVTDMVTVTVAVAVGATFRKRSDVECFLAGELRD